MTLIANQSVRSLNSNAGTSIPFTLKNPLTGQSDLYIGKACDLELTLTNRTGKEVGIGANAKLELLWPAGWFSLEALNSMKPSLEGFEAKNIEDQGDMLIEFTATKQMTWKVGETLTGKIGNIVAKGEAGGASVALSFEGFTGDLPLQPKTNLILLNPPVEGNASLVGALQLSLDSQGSVYVSQEGDPIRNTLFLNLKNQKNTPLFTGPQRNNNPEVRVRFIYGNTPGSLAPDSDRNQPVEGSAWLINGGIEAMMGNKWVPRNPRTTDIGSPEWLFTPSNDNIQVIGTGDKSNITFSFSNIVSFTQPGHTQMIVVFTGFYANEKQKYDDAAFILDIPKQAAPPTRGILNLFSRTPIIPVQHPNQKTLIQLRWAMFHVAFVDLIVGVAGKEPQRREYPQAGPVHFDNVDIDLTGVTQDQLVPITLQAYSKPGGFLNSAQFTLILRLEYFKDPRDGQTYPIIQVGNKVWMARDLAWKAPAGSKVPNNQNAPVEPRGYLYTLKAARERIPEGWRLPSMEDWKELVEVFGGREEAYSQLIEGGNGGFNAQLSGKVDDMGNVSAFKEYGMYWTDTPDSQNENQNLYASFSSLSKKVSLASQENPNNHLSVRLVRNLY